MEQRGGGRRTTGGLYPKPAPGALASVQAFLNTRNVMGGEDLLDGVEPAAGWLVRMGLLDGGVVLDEGTRVRLVEFREALRGLLRAEGLPQEADVATLNEAAEDALLRVGFEGDGTPRLWAVGSGEVAGGVVARLLVAVARAASEGTWGRLKICRNEGCMWAFYDGSKNRSGSWCTMDVCGSRAKMRAYRRRRSS